MKHPKIIVAFLLTAGTSIFTQTSCKNQIMCDMMFAMITVTVQGDTVKQAYVVDLKTQDTIDRTNDNINGADYKIVDDSYMQKLSKNEMRTFHFVATSNSSKTVEADFIISKSDCHIEKKMGPSIVQFQ